MAPRDFWALSLREWRALCSARSPAGAGLKRSEFDRLLKEHPDGQSKIA